MNKEQIEKLRRNCQNWAFDRIAREAGDYMVTERIEETTKQIDAIFDAALAAIDYVATAENRDPDRDWQGRRLDEGLDAYGRMCAAVQKLTLTGEK